MYETIPYELKSKRCWVNVWNSSKVPMQSTIRKAASASNPDTWSTFEDAASAVEQGVYDGIGYVFCDDGIVGIDIDDGYDKDGFLNPLAADIIGRCGSYTEKSRSGRGVHILIKGVLPFKGKNNREAVEIYRTSRYFIMTGKTLIFSKIQENQSAIDYVVEKYFPDVAKDNNAPINNARIYSPIYRRPENGKLALRPEYPPITPGSRNLSLTSLAGQLHNQGYTKAEIYKELLYANSCACTPPLPQNEVELIVNSVTRYRR